MGQGHHTLRSISGPVYPRQSIKHAVGPVHYLLTKESSLPLHIVASHYNHWLRKRLRDKARRRRYAVRGHSRSLILIPVERRHTSC